LKLYAGYVARTNGLTEEIAALTRDGPIDGEAVAVYSELKRHLGYEYNGMVLHELYFDNLKEGGDGNLPVASRFERAAISTFGSLERWKSDFTRTANLRGVGWAICCLDPAKGRQANLWVSSHEVGHVAGLLPILVLDVWEHAYLLDYAPAERPKYIEAFLSNLNWSAVEERLARTRLSIRRACLVQRKLCRRTTGAGLNLFPPFAAR
jgi:Fe-Mn family superoxide dismutase